MSAGIAALADEMERLQESVTRLTAQRDKLKTVNGINSQEIGRLMLRVDQLCRENSTLRSELIIANAALHQAGFAITEAVTKLKGGSDVVYPTPRDILRDGDARSGSDPGVRPDLPDNPPFGSPGHRRASSV